MFKDFCVHLPHVPPILGEIIQFLTFAHTFDPNKNPPPSHRFRICFKFPGGEVKFFPESAVVKVDLKKGGRTFQKEMNHRTPPSIFRGHLLIPQKTSEWLTGKSKFSTGNTSSKWFFFEFFGGVVLLMATRNPVNSPLFRERSLKSTIILRGGLIAPSKRWWLALGFLPCLGLPTLWIPCLQESCDPMAPPGLDKVMNAKVMPPPGLEACITRVCGWGCNVLIRNKTSNIINLNYLVGWKQVFEKKHICWGRILFFWLHVFFVEMGGWS